MAAVRLGRIDGQFVPFPTQDELEESDLDLIVSGSKDAILMIEGFAREMPENDMAEAIQECHRIIREICDLQNELFAKANVQKKQYEVPPPDGTLRAAQEPVLRSTSRPPSRPQASTPAPMRSRRSSSGHWRR